MKLLGMLLVLLVDIVMMFISLFTLMVVIPVGMFVKLIHHSITEFSILKGFVAADAHCANKICSWADNIKTIRLLLEPESEQALQDIQDAIDLSAKFGKLLDDTNNDDHLGNVERIAEFLEDTDIDERWEVKK